MVELIRRERRSAVLSPSALPCLRDLATVNLTAGCAHGCLYCYARSYPAHPGDGKAVFFTNTLQKIREELGRVRRRPPVVYFSPSSDPFQPLPQVLEMMYDVLALLFHEGLRVAFLSKGLIPDRHMKLLCANAPLVQAQIGISTLDQSIASTWEPGAATPLQRLRQLELLRDAGVKVRARLDPLIPGWTDEPASLEALCRALAAAGVGEISTSALFLRPEIVRTLARKLPDHRVLRSLLRHYPRSQAGHSVAGRKAETSLPRAVRQRMYNRVKDAAEPHGISVSICGCENPDITSERCHIAGDWPENPNGCVQTNLFSGPSSDS